MSEPARRSPPRLLRVRRRTRLTPGMVRITLAGDALQGFPLHSDGAHIKLMFARPHQAEPVLPTLGPNGPIWPPDPERPITRTYSVSRYDPAAGELDVDFVLHEHDGPGSGWARHAKVGAAVGVAGPGGPDRIKPGADWYLLVADPSALAALAAALRTLPPQARGYALVEVPSEVEIQPLSHPPGIQLRWLIRGELAAASSRLLLQEMQALAWLPGVPSVMLAGENSQVVALRDDLLQRGVPRAMLYAVPYWKDAHTEEAYHQERHRIMDELDSPAAVE